MYTSAGMPSSPGDLPFDNWSIAFSTSLSIGRLASSSLIATWGKRAMASWLMLAGRFRTLWKCLAHRSKIWFLSVSNWVPSALRRGGEPEG